jgi:DNA-binding NarL/FixJ family response regulator
MEVSGQGIVDIAIIEDHVVFQDGLRILLERRGCRVVGVAGSVAEAHELLRHSQPEVMVVGIHLPDGNGSDLVRAVRADSPGMCAVIYTGLDSPDLLMDAMECGAGGLVFKQAPLSDLVDAIRAVRRGERYFDKRLTALLDQATEDEPHLLSKRQREVLVLLAHGYNGEEIASRLCVSSDTVRTHVPNAMSRLHVRTRTHAVVEAMERHEIQA